MKGLLHKGNDAKSPNKRANPYNLLFYKAQLSCILSQANHRVSWSFFVYL